MNQNEITGFDRDQNHCSRATNWRCHICKKETPQENRGTTKPNAPEIDHIITLADGGKHIFSNVACCCRECNIKKGAQSKGQLILFGKQKAKEKARGRGYLFHRSPGHHTRTPVFSLSRN